MVNGGITLTEDTVGLWLAAENGVQDMLIHIADPVDDVPTMTIRFRHYVDDKVFDSEDEKIWHQLKGEKGEVQDMVTIADDLVKALAKEVDDVTTHRVLMGEGGLDAFTKEFMALPCIHAKEITKEEYEEGYQQTLN